VKRDIYAFNVLMQFCSRGSAGKLYIVPTTTVHSVIFTLNSLRSGLTWNIRCRDYNARCERTTAYSFRFTSLNRDDNIDAERCGTKNQIRMYQTFPSDRISRQPCDLTSLLTFVTFMWKTLRATSVSEFQCDKRVSPRWCETAVAKNHELYHARVKTELNYLIPGLYSDQVTNLNFSCK